MADGVTAHPDADSFASLRNHDKKADAARKMRAKEKRRTKETPAAVYSAAKEQAMSSPSFSATVRLHHFAASTCRSRRHQMPRRHLRVLPTLTRPSLFSGD
jgi:hypothetical protein